MSISLSKLPEPLTQEVNTPRSVLSCKKAGYQPKDLIYRPQHTLSTNKKIAEFLYQEVERDRQEAVDEVKKEYTEVCQGITEAEYELMGRPTALKHLAPQPKKEVLSDTKRQELIERRQQEIAVVTERFFRIQEFQQEKQREREEKNDELEARIKEREELDKKRTQDMAKETYSRNVKVEQERIQREEELQRKLAIIRAASDKKLVEINNRLQDFRDRIKQENNQKATQRSEKMEKSKIFYEQTMQQKEQKAEAKKLLDIQRDTERTKEIELKIQQLKDRIQKREAHIKENVEMTMSKTMQKKFEFSVSLDQSLKEHQQNYQAMITQISKDLGDKNINKAQKTMQILESFEVSAIKKLDDLQVKYDEQKKKYEKYQDEVLIEDRIKHEKYKLNEERGRQRAQRLMQLEEYNRKFKEAQLKLKFQKVEEIIQAKQAEVSFVQQSNAKFEAEKQKAEYEKYYGVNKKKLQGSQTGSPQKTRNALRPGTQSISPQRKTIQSRLQQQQEVQLIVQQEQEREKERRQILSGINDDQEKTKMLKVFTEERKQNADKIKQINKQHRLELGP
ncbi:hypothetical protein SS50377_27697 [Spironucleus salmonicida]|uniref:Uncharacterized protein n=1 Tax=Spironucleus salmonicida TaxID=348837 RepID=V6LPC2_9EUKA|nr:hypothetical protein SS50377_27697 [Spironucleus salmonicida]|eukprot:EST46527.1 hypothetical protein SS50377_13332 [Spironucleus salmonicida]